MIKEPEQVGNLGEKLRAAGFSPQSAAQRFRLTLDHVRRQHPRDWQAMGTSLCAILLRDEEAAAELAKFLVSALKAENVGRQYHDAEEAKRSVHPRPSSTGNILAIPAHLRGRPGAAQTNPILKITPKIPENPRPISASRKAGAIVSRSILKTFLIDGTPIGDRTPFECRNWMNKQRLSLTFVEMLIAGIPDNMRISAAISDDEAAKIYRRAQEKNHA